MARLNAAVDLIGPAKALLAEFDRFCSAWPVYERGRAGSPQVAE